MESAPAPTNLLNGTKRLFNNANYFGKNLVTIVDGVADRNAALNASTITSSGTGWYLIRTITSLTAGTYTIAIHATRNTGTDQPFKFYAPGSPGDLSATSSWQRFSYSFSHPGGTMQIGLNSTGANTDLIVSDFELFEGSSDLGPEAEVAGHMFLDKSKGDYLHTRSGNVLSLATTASHGFIQFPSDISTDQLTVVALVRKVSASSGYVNSISKVQSENAFSSRLELAGKPGLTVGNEWQPIVVQKSAGWDLTNRGWVTFAHRVNGDNRSIFFDQGKVDDSTNAPTDTTLRDLFVSIMVGVNGGGYEWGGLAMWDRALSDSEILAAQQALLDESGLTRGTVRCLIAGGDSLSGSDTGHVNLFLSNASPTVLSFVYSINGGILSDITPHFLDTIPDATVAGSKYIFSIMMTNADYSDSTAYLAALQSVCTQMKSKGALVAVGTLPPRNSTTYPTFPAFRAIVNPAIRLWVGTYIDAVYDFAADATVGTDAAGNNATYYPDGVHPTSDVQSTYFEPIYRAAINAL
jgi:lysophospholipase L1-like esterase